VLNGTYVNLEGSLTESVLRAIQCTTDLFLNQSVDTLKESGHRCLCVSDVGSAYTSDSGKYLKLVALGDVIGIPLVDALNAGATYYFHGDPLPNVVGRLFYSDGAFTDGNIRDEVGVTRSGRLVAYRVSTAPVCESRDGVDIESTILVAKVGFLSMSVDEFRMMKEIKSDLTKLKAKESNLPYLKGLIEELGL